MLPDRTTSIGQSVFFVDELSTLRAERVRQYYEHVIDSVELNRANPNNSYVMWAAGKVDSIDLAQPCLIQPAQVSLPDIDTDFTIKSRDTIIDYAREKYGKDKVCQMATFSRMQGRGAIKDVLRAHDRMSYEEMNLLTAAIPDEAEIADQLQEMREETGEASIIRWALENNPEALSQWAHLNDAGEIEGPLALDFAQAIRLEGTKRSMGKHASGVIICSEALADICPMVWDKSGGEPMVGVDMKDAEDCGLVKFDVLGLKTLDCLVDSESLIRTGKC